MPSPALCQAVYMSHCLHWSHTPLHTDKQQTAAESWIDFTEDLKEFINYRPESGEFFSFILLIIILTDWILFFNSYFIKFDDDNCFYEQLLIKF